MSKSKPNALGWKYDGETKRFILLRGETEIGRADSIKDVLAKFTELRTKEGIPPTKPEKVEKKRTKTRYPRRHKGTKND